MGLLGHLLFLIIFDIFQYKEQPSAQNVECSALNFLIKLKFEENWHEKNHPPKDFSSGLDCLSRSGGFKYDCLSFNSPALNINKNYSKKQ
ncbi:MAG: hypothetical protein A3I88_03300 [Candidatus Portnoybacteria bacterium RIFCSPLOWO2_12_FULL_39_9]|uniref:Uncharacterized protein n=1 Tax=Candidatus Portnoybacteria bacterium RIFCSPHIGHO2_12_FULL_38_9 TaxID=1801997 RepID=A0A1G2FG04_9BACT|nr:MAG: hypothetical protein A3H00_00270 [Candidatus Portnoybacteria bacterium RBG_13_40_8]OGZ36058.1 MAG: hypothetical protein A2646_00905 [Candidatus Portnoybacteria bacterium RIFCSPHIGHO2_02_FULL_39_12]OGZ36747.1 MAG: hypothetical protein A3J64_03405 [Candidatus Portnoybacteria bacterium RIFCSPHIGHO2_12_FULL_38_9]OGZ38106.1 MAG: hypothetical protein A3F21_01005 [Candidatus Portnoybacteria bacterium RIFCSPLOWO2_01_FULL_38_39]OGZ40113.1 MAG: hypothetical protein A3I88_03300 [Candidatus Portnoy